MINIDPGTGRSAIKEGDDQRKNNRIFGDTIKEKEEDNVRIFFQNINGFGYSDSSVKSSSVKNLIKKHNIDIMAMAEMNLNWGKLSRKQTLPQVCRKWFTRSKTVVAYNQHERRRRYKHQPGGTAIITKGNIAQRIMSSQGDTKRLGRWSSQAFQGKDGIVTRVVAVYVPNLTSKHRHKKVACQQQRALLFMNITDNVIKVY